MRSPPRFKVEKMDPKQIMGSAFKYNQNRVNKVKNGLKTPRIPKMLNKLLISRPVVSLRICYCLDQHCWNSYFNMMNNIV